MEAAQNTSNEYNLLVLGGRCDDLCTTREFLDGAMDEAQGVVDGKVPHQYVVSLKAIVADDRVIEVQEHLSNFQWILLIFSVSVKKLRRRPGH